MSDEAKHQSNPPEQVEQNNVQGMQISSEEVKEKLHQVKDSQLVLADSLDKITKEREDVLREMRDEIKQGNLPPEESKEQALEDLSKRIEEVRHAKAKTLELKTKRTKKNAEKLLSEVVSLATDTVKGTADKTKARIGQIIDIWRNPAGTEQTSKSTKHEN